MPRPTARPLRESDGLTIEVPTSEGLLYITVNLHNKNQTPYEVFIHFNAPFSSAHAYLDGIGRLLSLHLRQGGHLRQAINQLRGIGGPSRVGETTRPLFSTVDAVAWGLSELEGELYSSNP